MIDFSEGHNFLTALNSWYLSLVRGKDSERKVTTWYRPFDFDLNMHFFIPKVTHYYDYYVKRETSNMLLIQMNINKHDLSIFTKV